MHLNLEYGDWFLLDALQGRAVVEYGYDSPVWAFVRDVKLTIF